jgi:hypothetical protein
MVIKRRAHLSENRSLLSILLPGEGDWFCSCRKSSPFDSIISADRPIHVLVVGSNWFQGLGGVSGTIGESLLLWTAAEFADGFAAGLSGGDCACYSVGDVFGCDGCACEVEGLGAFKGDSDLEGLACLLGGDWAGEGGAIFVSRRNSNTRRLQNIPYGESRKAQNLDSDHIDDLLISK